MKTILEIKHPLFQLLSILAVWMQIEFIPKLDLILLLGCSIFLDLAAGFIKARKSGTIQKGKLLDTGYKIAIYSIIISSVTIMANVMVRTPGKGEPMFDYSIISDITICFLSTIEIYSTFKNIASTYPNSVLSMYLINPLIKLLEGKFKSQNPFNNNQNTSQ